MEKCQYVINMLKFDTKAKVLFTNNSQTKTQDILSNELKKRKTSK